MEDNIENRVLEVLSSVLKVSVTPQFAKERDTIWDSLKHIEILFALEEEFSIEFAEEVIEKMVSVEAIVEIVKSNLNET